MVKLIESSQFSDVPDIGMKLAEFNSPALSKEAESVFGRSYDSLKPTDDRFVGIHLTALGDEETYGPNRNFDSFPKEACIKYHDTFVKHGHVFSHHHNDASKDPILGFIKASAYNDKMHRVELFIWADKEKAHEGLEQLEKTGESSHSMACRVPWDECSCCGAHRKNSSDPNMCDHIRHQLGKVAEDGKVAFMRNVLPDFFDISFVTRPADRIAYSLKVASEDIVTSEEMAKVAGIIEPSHLNPGIEADKRHILRKLAEQYDSYCRNARPALSFATVAKAAESALDDRTIDTLRAMTVKEAMAFLADRGVVLSPDSFCKYAMGPSSSEYAAVGRHSDAIGRLAAQVIKEAAWLDKFSLASDSAFDVDRFTSRPSRRFTDVAVAGDVVKQASFTDRDNLLRLVSEGACLPVKTAAAHIDTNSNLWLNTLDKPILATALKYAEYKVSALNSMLSGECGLGTSDTNSRDTLVALVAAQDL